VLWGLLPIGLKIALTGIDAMTLTWYRFVAAALVLAVVLGARGRLPRLASLSRQGWALLLIATVCLAANYLLYVLGLERSNASTTQVVIQIAPLLLAIGGIWVFQESFGVRQWLGMAMLIVGLLVFSRDQVANLLSDIGVYYLGVLFVGAAAVSWALYGLAQKQLLATMASPAIMLCIYTGSALLFTPLAEPARIVEMHWPQLAALVFCMVNTLVAYGTFAEALAHWEASRVSAVLALVPLVTLSVVGVAGRAAPELFAPEPVSLVGGVAAGMVVAGAMMAALGRGA